jgi:hypothetical protein
MAAVEKDYLLDGLKLEDCGDFCGDSAFISADFSTHLDSSPPKWRTT